MPKQTAIWGTRVHNVQVSMQDTIDVCPSTWRILHHNGCVVGTVPSTFGVLADPR